MLEQKHNEEQKADAANSQPAYCKTDVSGSQSPKTQTEISRQLKIDVTEGRVWVQIGNVGVGFDKVNFIRLIEQSESYQFAASLVLGSRREQFT